MSALIASLQETARLARTIKPRTPRLGYFYTPACFRFVK